MAKYYGKICFIETIETEIGVWEEQITERFYYGDLIKNTRKLQTPQTLNDDLNVDNKISILADPYACENFHSMRYAEFMGAKWKITSIEVQYPRLILNIGGLYNEQN